MIDFLNKINETLNKDNDKYLYTEVFCDPADKEVLLENIPLSLYRDWIKELKRLGVNHKERYQNIFGNDENGKPRMRIYIPLGGTVQKVGEPHKKIKKILEDNGYTIKDYLHGICLKPAPEGKKRQEMQIGRALTEIARKLKNDGKTEEAKKAGYAERIWKDEGTKNAEYLKSKSGEETEEEKKKRSDSGYVVISRHPYDLMGVSGDRHWASCQSVIDTYGYPAKGPNASSRERGGGKREQKDVERIHTPLGTSKKDIYVRDEKGEIVKDEKGRYKLKPGVERAKVKVSDFTPEMKKAVHWETKNGKQVLVPGPGKTPEETKQNFAHDKKGMHYMGVQGDVRWGALVAYWINSDDLNINNPKERLLIKPYYRSDNEVYLFPDPNSYGERGGTTGGQESTPAFRSTVQKWLNQHQTSAKGVYHLKSTSHGTPWAGHYPERGETVQATSPAVNEDNIRDLRDDLKWDDVIDVYSDFSMSKFKNAVIGERGNKLVFYDGVFEDGNFDGIFLGGTFKGGNFKGTFGAESEPLKEAEGTKPRLPVFEGGNIVQGTFKNCIIQSAKVQFRVIIKENVTVTGSLTITGKVDCSNASTTKVNKLIYGTYQHPAQGEGGTPGIIWKNTEFQSIEQRQEELPENVKILYEKCVLNNAVLTGKIIDCTLGGNVKLKKNTYLEGRNTKWQNLNLTGGTFGGGIVTSGTLTDVTIKKIITKEGMPRFKNCTIEHGIINGGVFQDCKFLAGRFLKGRWFGGEFLGGTFEGGDFSDGKFGKNAIWKGGRWHGGEKEKAETPTHDIEKPSKKELAKANKEMLLKKRKIAQVHKDLDIEGRVKARLGRD